MPMLKLPRLRRALPAAALLLGLAAAGCAVQSSAPGPGFLVFYTPFSANLDADASRIVGDAAKAALAEPSRQVYVLGYADSLGSTQANGTLTRLRAQVVRDALVAAGIPASRITLQPKGAQGGDPGVESRRVEIELR